MTPESTVNLILAFTTKTGQFVAHSRQNIFILVFSIKESIIRHLLAYFVFYFKRTRDRTKRRGISKVSSWLPHFLYPGISHLHYNQSRHLQTIGSHLLLGKASSPLRALISTIGHSKCDYCNTACFYIQNFKPLNGLVDLCLTSRDPPPPQRLAGLSMLTRPFIKYQFKPHFIL